MSLSQPTASSQTIAAAVHAAQMALQAAWPAGSLGAPASCSAVAVAAAASAAAAMGAADLGRASGLIQLHAGSGGSWPLAPQLALSAPASQETADQAANEAAAELKELKWQHKTLQEKHAALQAQFEALSLSHESLREAHAELRDREAEHSAEARAEKRAGEAKDEFLAHLKQQNEEWRAHSIAVLELKKDKDKKERELR
jgi:hypothetical protein